MAFVGAFSLIVKSSRTFVWRGKLGSSSVTCRWRWDRDGSGEGSHAAGRHTVELLHPGRHGHHRGRAGHCHQGHGGPVRQEEWRHQVTTDSITFGFWRKPSSTPCMMYVYLKYYLTVSSADTRKCIKYSNTFYCAWGSKTINFLNHILNIWYPSYLFLHPCCTWVNSKAAPTDENETDNMLFICCLIFICRCKVNPPNNLPSLHWLYQNTYNIIPSKLSKHPVQQTKYKTKLIQR